MSTTEQPSPLADQIAELRAGMRGQAPDDVLAVFDAEADGLAASDLEAGILGAGQAAPGFALTDAEGGTVRLEDLLAAGPAVVTFYRGAWCPYCNLQLRAFQAVLPQLEDAGVRLVAISPQRPDGSLTTKEKAELTFDVLSDPGNAVARAYGATFTLEAAAQATALTIGNDIAAANADGTWELPVPATYLVDRDGTIAWSEGHADYRRRTEPDAVLAAVARLAPAG